MVMMTKQTIFLVAILMLLDGEDNGMTPASAFSPTILSSSSTAMKSSSLSMVSREDYLRPRFYSAPTTKPTSTTTPIVITKTNNDDEMIEEDDNHRMTSLDMNRVQYCADEGCCDLEEMSQLLQDLERMRDECSTVAAAVGPNNPIPHECSVEQHATREMYMDELGYQMERFMHRKLQQQEQQQQLESNKEDLDAEDEEIRMSDQVMNEDVDEEEDVLKQHLQRMRDIASYEEH